MKLAFYGKGGLDGAAAGSTGGCAVCGRRWRRRRREPAAGAATGWLHLRRPLRRLLRPVAAPLLRLRLRRLRHCLRLRRIALRDGSMLHASQTTFRRADKSFHPHHDAMAQNGTGLAIGVGFTGRVGEEVEPHHPANNRDPADSIAENLLFHSASAPETGQLPYRYGSKSRAKQAPTPRDPETLVKRAARLGDSHAHGEPRGKVAVRKLDQLFPSPDAARWHPGTPAGG